MTKTVNENQPNDKKMKTTRLYKLHVLDAFLWTDLHQERPKPNI